MPLYEYKCADCGGLVEVIQKFSDAPLTVHEACGGRLERLISPAGLQFKGRGWDVSGYAKGGSKSGCKPAAGSSNGPGTGKSSRKPPSPESDASPSPSGAQTAAAAAK